MSNTRLVVVTVPPGPNPWRLYFADAVGTDDDMTYIRELSTWPAMTARECIGIEEMLFAQYHVVVVSPWRYEIEWWDADIEDLRAPGDGPTQFRRSFAYQTIPERDGDLITVSLTRRPVHAEGVPVTEKLFTVDSASATCIDQRLQDSGATVASEWVEVANGRLRRARVAFGRDFPDEV